MKNPATLPNGAPQLRFSNILVPIDFSARSIHGITVAKRLAQRTGARIHLLHVQEYFYPAALMVPGAPPVVAPMRDFEEWRKTAEAHLRHLAKDHGLTGTCRAEIAGAPFDMICHIAHRIPADLIVTTTHGRTGLKRALLGSTTERVVQHAPCPVFVARERKTRSPGPKKILVPVDFSDCSLGGLQYAIAFAKKFGAGIVVLHVVDIEPELMMDTTGMFPVPSYKEITHRTLDEHMHQFLRRVNFDGVPFTTAIVTQFPADGICQAATKKKAELIIMATHGRTGLTHLLIGSTAEVVTRHASCPVLVVPSHPEVRTANLVPLRAGQTKTKRKGTIARSKRLPGTGFSRRYRESIPHPMPERRQTNKFRESHFA